MPVSFPYRCFCRTYQQVVHLSLFPISWSRPELLKGKNAVKRLPSFIKGKKLQNAFLMSDEVIMRLGLGDSLLEGFAKEGIPVTVYKNVSPNPTIQEVEDALKVYKENKCDHLVALGGGSVMDACKLVGARVARPRTSIPGLRGPLGVMGICKKLPPLFAIPTTSGTGSEATIAAVVRNPETHEKYAVIDRVLVPPYAVLDPVLTVGLPKFITATTGMDALTHAVESYLNRKHIPQTEKDGLETVRLVFKNLRKAYNDGNDMEARGNMQEAAYLGGLAFTRAFVGNVHALAHVLGAYYDIPHGYANAVLLPHVLEKYGDVVYPRLADLADAAGIQGKDVAEKAKNFIEAVKQLNADLNIPSTLANDPKYKIKDEDIPAMVKHALKEANPLYPVPVIFGEEEMTDILNKVK